MLTWIIGGSGSGKSAFAEDYAVRLQTEHKIYLATMEPFGEEGHKRIKRHQALRQGKGFYTIEQPANLTQMIPKLPQQNTCVLLECFSNLVANEMFAGSEIRSKERVFEKITHDMNELLKATTHLVVVSNQIFEDGCAYDRTTRAYIETMGLLHQHWIKQADKAIEVVAGIPVFMK